MSEFEDNKEIYAQAKRGTYIIIPLPKFVSLCNQYKEYECEKFNGNDRDAHKLAKYISNMEQTDKEKNEDSEFCRILKERIDTNRKYKFFQDENIEASIDALNPYKEKILDQKWHVLIAMLAYYDIASFGKSDILEKSTYNIGKINKIIINTDERLRLKVK